MILGILVIALVLLIFVQGKIPLQAQERSSQFLETEERVRSVTETLAFGQIKKVTLVVPDKTKICFIDSRKEKRSLLYYSNDHCLTLTQKSKS
jgi:hypothetical protein